MSLIRADARRIPLVEGCVQCVVTSPPYWGLRDYGTARWSGGDPKCDHKESRQFVNPKNTLGPNGHLPESNAANQMHQRQFRDVCGKCGGRRIDSQIGLESTPDAYVQTMVQVFAEVWRVLKDDGTVWLNLGDSYVSNGRYESDRSTFVGDLSKYDHRDPRPAARALGIKPKDLVGIPWRVAFALQAAGWYLRSDIIWSKPNPMPESVTDRPTKAHEYIFLLSKRERYYYNSDAINEKALMSGGGQVANADTAGRNGARPGRFTPDQPSSTLTLKLKDTRNKRSVWHVATQPYSGSHFATFPEALIEPCIMAGSRPGDLVYDPFIGSGTTGVVCDRLMRRWVGTDLSYQHLSKQRTAQRGLRLEDEATACRGERITHGS